MVIIQAVYRFSIKVINLIRLPMDNINKVVIEFRHFSLSLERFTLLCCQDENYLSKILSYIRVHYPDFIVIDDIEGGVHYSRYLSIIGGLYGVSLGLGVPVIASTQSREFVEYAHEYFKGVEGYPFRYIRISMSSLNRKVSDVNIRGVV